VPPALALGKATPDLLTALGCGPAAAFRADLSAAGLVVPFSKSTLALTLLLGPRLSAAGMGGCAKVTSTGLGELAGDAALASLSILKRNAISFTLLPS
jgi:hypothetical protein